jgi:alpha-tubulin suppressor-like RCC1 family protein
MSELKKKPSGAAYKRKAKEKEEKHQNVINRVRRIIVGAPHQSVQRRTAIFSLGT